MKRITAGVTVLLVWLAVPAAQMPDGVRKNPILQVGQPKSEDAARWLIAAAEHRPGVADDAVVTIGAWPLERLRAAFKRVVELKGGDAFNPLLARGAMLHADISIFQERIEITAAPQGRRVAAIVAVDGRQLGVSYMDEDLMFAREVIGAMRPAAADPRARLWFRAIGAALAARYWLLDLGPHNEDARRFFPRDAGVLFDSACEAESVTSPRVQAVVPPPVSLGKANLETLRLQRRLGIPFNLDLAGRLYRAALAEDPAFDEARVRLAHVLWRRQQHKEAASLLATPVQTTDPSVRYYAALVRGRILQSLGQLDSARAAYDDAARLAPRGQSPRLALAALAREQGDAAAAVAAIQQVEGWPATAQRDDPWWSYYACNGRNAETMLRQLRAAFPTEEMR